MTRITAFRLIALLASSLLAFGCGKAGRQGSKDVLAVVDGEEITIEKYRKVLKRSLEQGARNYSRPGAKETLLWKVIDEAVVAAHARKSGYEEDPEIVDFVRARIVRKFLEDRLQPKYEAIETNEEDLRKFYDENPSFYQSPERVRPAVIWLRKPTGASPEKIAELRARVEEALNRAKMLDPSVADFGAVAEDYSQEVKSRSKGGVMGWLIDGEIPAGVEEQLVDVAFSLENEGDVSDVIETERWFYIVKLVDRQSAQRRSFVQMREAVRIELSKRRHEAIRREFLDGLRDELDWQILEHTKEVIADLEVAGLSVDDGREEAEQSKTAAPRAAARSGR